MPIGLGEDFFMADNKKTSIGGKTTCHLLNIKKPGALQKRLKRGFNRVEARVSSVKTGKITKGSLSFLDINEEGCSVFVSELLSKGSEIEVIVTDPCLLKAYGVVAWCVPVYSRVDRPNNRFRAGIQFIFHSEIQRRSVVEYCQKAALDPMQELAMSEATVIPAEAHTAEAPPMVAESPSEPPPVVEVPASTEAPAEEAPAAVATEEEKKVA